MPVLNIKLDGEGCWPDLSGKGPDQVIDVASPIDIALAPRGMMSGKASIAIRLDLPDGRTVIAQTSFELFEACARAFRSRLQYLAELERKGGRSS
jgi:hypothetical protein